MNKISPLRIFLGFVAVVVILVGGALLLLPRLISTPQIVARTEAILSESLPLEAEIGTMRLKVFPRLSFGIEGFSLRDPALQKPLLNARSTSVDIALLPLLKRQVVLQALMIEEPEITLPQGYTLPVGEEAQGETPEKPPGGFDVHVSFKNIRITDGSLTITGESAQDALRIFLHRFSAQMRDGQSPTEFAISLRGFDQDFSFSGSFSNWNALLARENVTYGLSAEYDDEALFSLNGTFYGRHESLANGILVDGIAKSSVSEKLPFLDVPEMLLPLGLGSSFYVKSDQRLLEFSLPDLVIDAGENNVYGKISVQKPASGPLKISGRMEGNAISLPAGPQERNENTSKTLLPHDIPLPLDALQTIDLDFDLSLESLRYGAFLIEKPHVSPTIKMGRLTMPFDAVFYGGALRALVMVDKAGSGGLDASIDGLRVGDLVQTVSGKTLLEGKLQATIDTRFSGKTSGDVLASLNGDVGFSMEEAALLGVDAGKFARFLASIQTGKDLLNTRNLEALRNLDLREPDASTAILQSSFDGKLENGVLHTKEHVFRTPLIDIPTLEGTIDLFKETIDLDVEIRAYDPVRIVGGKSEKPLEPLIALRADGTLRTPKFGINKEKMLKNLLESEAKEVLLDKIPGAKTLSDFFSRDKKDNDAKKDD